MSDEQGKEAPQQKDKGQVVGGDYRIVKYLGGGGMGKVFLAHQISLDRKVALKTIRTAYQHDVGLLKRFYNEAKLSAKMSHPNIVQVHSVFKEDGLPFIIMEYVEGGALSVLLGQRKQMPWKQALKVVGQIAAGLAYAHSQGVVHRDIKPDNIFLDHEGHARILDFGLAKVNQAPSNLTLPGMMIGTPAYMSPEQCSGQSAGPASDIYALGVVLYQVLAGKRPFSADNPIALTQKIIVEHPEPINETVPDLPADVVWLVNNMMHKDPEQRLLGKALCDAIANVLSGKPVTEHDGMVDVMEALRTELAGESTAAEFNMTTPSLVDGVTFSQPTPSTISALKPPEREKKRGGGLLAKLAFAVLAIGALGAAGFMWQQQQKGAGGNVIAGVLLQSVYRNFTEDILSVKVEEDEIRYRPIGWSKDGRYLYLNGRDEADGWQAQWQSMAVVDRDRKNVYQLDYAAIEENFPNPVVPAGTPGGGGRGGVLYFTYKPSETGAGDCRELVFKNAVDFTEDVLFKASYSPEYKNDPAYFGGMLAGGAVHPSGRRIALVVTAKNTKGKQLVERELDWTPENKVSEPILEAKHALRLFGYSPDGRHLAAQTIANARGYRDSVIWAAPSNNPGAKPKRLGPGGNYSTYGAFHPNEDVLLVSYRTDDNGPYTCYAVGLGGGEALRFEGGRIGARPWHPSGDFFVYTAQDGAGAWQLFKVDYPSGNRVQLTGPQGVITSIPSVAASGDTPISPDGEWIAALHSNQQIVFAKLSLFLNGS